ncbi:MAG: 4-amino-4-deoxy-L-arabinose transferase and related glycosyltransferases of PMT family [uncultured Gemmatimonadaceae bacterium]|uniref:4-amino-4-deoxy-L-arabinose transferase and related glycosyltransferases of PMT family n=1 Tax=uncultured Gemmatimonadaceae bacterium TaxID=246130 RepID=A0A6J4K5I0_9BACT|nr:MAG: 4-amino-4-deoxy-L-arabinose transferase and related glycosyltransferases of PMT family [uncultured Gemmatimonadaceae bacterium]
MSAAPRVAEPPRVIGPADGVPPPPRPAEPGGSGDPGRASARWPWWLALGGLLFVSLLLRVWGADHGMPYAYNADENSHFVPRAIGLYGHDWNPDYFVNPPAYTYVVHVVFSIWFGGREGVSRLFATDPTEVWVVARLTVAVLGTIGVWLLYLAGARLLDRRVGLLAAALSGLAFLPVFYSHLALNDVPTVTGVCLALYGIAGVLRLGRHRDYVIAGVGLGVACATKYTGGIVLLPLIAAAAVQAAAPGGRGIALRGLAISSLAALVTFVVANPYALLDFPAFWDGITHQSSAAGGETQGKLGLTQDNGWLYYLWSFTWGLGWIPLLAAAVALPLLWRDERRLVWVLAPAPIVFVLFMGMQDRFFGRWLLPVFPMMCLLAAFAAIDLADRAARWKPALRPTFLAIAAVALCAQGVVYSLHIGQVLSREDTRNLTRAWMVEHLPPRTKIVIEPIAPDAFAQDIGNPSRLTSNGNRWVKFPTSRSRIDVENPTGPLLDPPGAIVGIEDYERTLVPGLIDEYKEQNFCWVIVGSTQRGRAEADAEEVPGALAYYRKLERESRLAYEASPYAAGEGPVEFNFDWSFDYYPRDYHRPGPVMTVYRLKTGRCAG